MYVIHNLNKNKIITFKKLASGSLYIYINVFIHIKQGPIKLIKNDSKEISNITKDLYFK